MSHKLVIMEREKGTKAITIAVTRVKDPGGIYLYSDPTFQKKNPDLHPT